MNVGGQIEGGNSFPSLASGGVGQTAGEKYGDEASWAGGWWPRNGWTRSFRYFALFSEFGIGLSGRVAGYEGGCTYRLFFILPLDMSHQGLNNNTPRGSASTCSSTRYLMRLSTR